MIVRWLMFTALVCCGCNAYLDFGDNYNFSDGPDLVPVPNKYGGVVYVSKELLKKLKEDGETWHFTPWMRTRTVAKEDRIEEVCPNSEPSTSDFPDSIFTEDQLRMGGFLLYMVFGMYTFTLLAVVCNDFFIPCVELICEDLKIPQNVAAATFMSVATSCPEFFVNVIATFLTQSDMGIGTIVGSAIFNALGVAAIGGLAAVTPIAIEMGPVTRDVIIYMVNVGVLVSIVWDGQVDWYEALALFILYIVYFIIMFNSAKVFYLYEKLFGRCCSCNMKDAELNMDENVYSQEGIENKAYNASTEVLNQMAIQKRVSLEKIDEAADAPKMPRSIFKLPRGKSKAYQCWWVYSWPLKLVLLVTIPSPIRFRKLYPLSFIMCIIWIGVNSYFVSWSMTVIGTTFGIPESVMGMTFLAFGGCLPEACSIFIMSRRGEGGIGVSNALGANSLAILFALGTPWLIKTLALVIQGADQQAILINSAGIDFVIGSLMVAVITLWVVLFIGKFKLRKITGGVLLCLYAIFITFAILVEIGVILNKALIC